MSVFCCLRNRLGGPQLDLHLTESKLDRWSRFATPATTSALRSASSTLPPLLLQPSAPFSRFAFANVQTAPQRPADDRELDCRRQTPLNRQPVHQRFDSGHAVLSPNTSSQLFPNRDEYREATRSAVEPQLPTLGPAPREAYRRRTQVCPSATQTTLLPANRCLCGDRSDAAQEPLVRDSCNWACPTSLRSCSSAHRQNVWPNQNRLTRSCRHCP